MTEEQTTIVVQRYLDELASDTPTEPIIRALLDWSMDQVRSHDQWIWHVLRRGAESLVLQNLSAP